MDLLLPQDIKALLSKYETRPSKGLGQNFLIDKKVLEKIIDCAELKSNDFVLEVGPGLGTLTQELAKRAGSVVAIEKDKTMIEILGETLKGFNNIKIIHSDILKSNILASPSLRGVATTKQSRTYEIAASPEAPRNDEIKKYKVVANIPYYLTSPLIRLLLENDPPAGGLPETIILMIQKEVAERICSKPGKMSLLAVSVQFYAEAKIVSLVPKNCFWPAPKVDSAIIKITPRGPTSRPTGGQTSPDSTSPDLFFKVVKAGFSHPRKQLLGNLSEALELSKEKTFEWLSKNNISPTQRAETLSVENWKNLANSL